jgi:two-component system, NtrC family, sensor kinase
VPAADEPLARRVASTAFRLGAAFAAVLALFGAALVVMLWALGRLAQAEDELARLDHAKHAGHNVAAQLREQYIHQAQTIIVEDASHLPRYEEATKAVRAATRGLVGLAATDEEKRRAAEIARLAEVSDIEFRSGVAEALGHHDGAALRQLHEQSERNVNEVVRKTDELNAIFEARSAAALAENNVLRRQVRLVTLACFGLAIVVAAVVGLLLMRSIVRPIAALRAGAERVGAGDLDVVISVSGRDELAALAAAFNRMTSDLTRHQEALVRSQKLASIGQVAAGVAHEINNPLGVMLGYLKLLRRDPALTGREELGIIEDEAHQCQRIVRELLDLARPQRLELAAVDLTELARDAALRLAESERLSGVEVCPPPAGAAAVVVRADDTRLRQVVNNVVMNAVEAGARRITLENRTHDSVAALVIGDDGPGMSPEVRERVFDPFFTTKPTGTGMGLAIAGAIIDAHAGRIEIDASPGAGTAVTMWLPVDERR